MSRWFRFYDDAVNDPKVQRLPGDLFKAWVNLLCLASKNKGELPPVEDIAFGLRMTEEEVGAILDELVSRHLIDEWDNRLSPHNWRERQPKSDTDPTNAERQQRHRERNALRNGDDNADVTPLEKRREDKKENITRVPRSNDWPSGYREQFWKAYPKKVDKQAAFRKLDRIWKADSVGWPLLLAAVRAYAQSVVGTEPKWIKSPEVWLNKGCWEDELPSAPKVFAAMPSGLIHVMRESPEWASWAEIYRQRKGKDPPIDKTGGWTFETSWASEAAE